MYESHFGFSGPPFQLNPDPSFYFNSRGHGHALAYLRYGAAQGEGFIVVTGEIGAGKTTLVRTLLDELDRAKIVPAQIVSTQLAEGELLQAILSAYGIPSQGTSKASLLATLEAFLMALATQGRRALLIVDEAQNLQTKVIEELRMLSNFQLGTHALMQSFLVGQPELRKKLESPDLEQLRQRVTASCHLGPLDIPETQAYIAHRLRRVGWDGNRPHFSEAAYREIHRWSGGVPRRINRLCNRILLATFLENSDEVTVDLAQRTAIELREEIGESFDPMPPAQTPVQTAATTPSVAVDIDTSQPVDALVAPQPSVVAATPAVPTVPALNPVAPLRSVVTGAADSADAAVSEPVAPSSIDSLVASPSVVVDVSQTLGAVTPGAVGEPVLSPAETVVRERAPVPDVVRTENIVLKPGHGVVLCLVDSASAALKAAAIAKLVAAVDGGPRMVLVNPGRASQVWPWGEMESILPTLELGLHFGIKSGSAFHVATSVLLEDLAGVIDEFSPLGMLAIGDSDALVACVLMSRKRGVPVLRVEAGDRSGSDEASLNAVLIEHMSDVLFASHEAQAHQALQRIGIAPERVVGVPGRLADDIRAAVASAMTTPDGALMRHSLPMFLGPRWSAEVDGTAYAVVALEAVHADQVQVLVDVLLAVYAVPKLIWLVSEDTAQAISDWRLQHPELADKVFETDDVKLDRSDIDRRNTANILCSRIINVADQFSILRGAVGLIAEPAQVLVDAAKGFEVPCLMLRDRRLSVINTSDAPQENHAWGAIILNEKLAQFVAKNHPRDDAGSAATQAKNGLPDDRAEGDTAASMALEPGATDHASSSAAESLAAWLVHWSTGRQSMPAVKLESTEVSALDGTANADEASVLNGSSAS